MRFKQYLLGEAKLKNVVDPSTVFSDLEEDIFFTLFVDDPSVIWDSKGFNEETIELSSLIPTQEHVDGQVDNDDPITVVRRNGKNYVIDGHHRMFTAEKKKAKKIECNVLDLPSEKITDLNWFSEKLGIPLKTTYAGTIVRG